MKKQNSMKQIDIINSNSLLLRVENVALARGEGASRKKEGTKVRVDVEDERKCIGIFIYV